MQRFWVVQRNSDNVQDAGQNFDEKIEDSYPQTWKQWLYMNAVPIQGNKNINPLKLTFSSLHK